MSTSLSLKRRGFTLIEIVIALAIASFLLVAVYAATQSSIETARRQSERGAESARMERFREIFLRDLQGWFEPSDKNKEAQAQGGATKGEAVLFELSTTADSLLTASETELPARTIRVRYVQEEERGRFRIFRIEEGGDLRMEVLQSVEQPVFEIYTDLKWCPIEKDLKPLRNQPIRVRLGERIACFYSQ